MPGSGTVIMTTDLRIKENEEQAAIEILDALVARSRAEQGCVSYCYYRAKGDKMAYFLLEKWEGKAAFASHRESAHLRSGLDALAALWEVPPVFKAWIEA